MRAIVPLYNHFFLENAYPTLKVEKLGSFDKNFFYVSSFFVKKCSKKMVLPDINIYQKKIELLLLLNFYFWAALLLLALISQREN